jgi:glucose-6-phosphate 1-dehydrogenase
MLTIQQPIGRRQSSAQILAAEPFMSQSLTIIIFGASGDLSKKKTFPSVYDLFERQLIPENSIICGFGRKEMSDEELCDFIRPNLKSAHEHKVNDFLQRVHYFRGEYNSQADAVRLHEFLSNFEKQTLSSNANRLYYFAIPPSIFPSAATAIRRGAMSSTGWTRIVVEKPFGRDLETAQELSHILGALFTEEEIYRIDHYLGKEMVQNLMVLRFGNAFLEPSWNREHIETIIVSFKEDFGVSGRAGYFDHYGIIRDILQNHLMQVLCLVAMEPPVSLVGSSSSDHIRNAKVEVLKRILPIQKQDVVIGQYEGYRSEEGVPHDSVTPTFAAIRLFVNSRRWAGVPFILKAGKNLDERKAEIRIQFKAPPASQFMFQGSPLGRNELVIRLQPNEAIYMKMNVKAPGFDNTPEMTALDLTYNERFDDEVYIPDAYTRLILEVVRGKQSGFVRTDELEASWRIFSPLLHELENSRVEPIIYAPHSRGPAESDQLLHEAGFEHQPGAVWKKKGSI